MVAGRRDGPWRLGRADGEMPGTQAATNDDGALAAEIGEGAQVDISGVVDCRAGTAKQRNDP